MPETIQNTNTQQRGDRRKRPTPFLSRYTFVGRRKETRRAEEQYNYYIDRLSARVWAIITLIIFLSVTDSLFTIYFLARGYREVNPLMNVALIIGKPVFITSKYIFTIIGVLVLGLHKNFYFVKGLIGLIIALYLFLNCYHLWLFFK
jgi:hypothetical protein